MSTFLDGAYVVSGTFSIPLGQPSSEADVGPRLLPTGNAGSAVLREFIAGEENVLVKSLLPMLARTDHSFSPLLLCGPTGAGKTMLAMGLVQHWKELHPTAKTLVITAADFARAHANAIETASQTDFRQKFASLSLVVLDDVQHLASKPGAQQEWRTVLDSLVQRSARVIVTSRISPAEMADFSVDLRSRLSGGLVVPLAWPARETRREMIARFFAAREQAVNAACLDRLASEVTGPPAQLFATLSRFAHTAQVDRRLLDEKLIAELLDERQAAIEITPRAIVAAVAKSFHVKVSDLKGPSRRQSIAEARGVAMYLIRQLTGSSYQEIGRQFAGRDHTTVLHACQKTIERVSSDPALKQTLDTLHSQLTGVG